MAILAFNISQIDCIEHPTSHIIVHIEQVPCWNIGWTLLKIMPLPLRWQGNWQQICKVIVANGQDVHLP